MLIKFKCPHCQLALNVGDDLAGEKATCPNCKKELTIPEKDSGIQNEEKGTAKKE
jgi:hypothetical protein